LAKVSCSHFCDFGSIGYLFERTIGLYDSWLDALEEAYIHGLKVIQVELLHPQRSYRCLICIHCLHLFLPFHCHFLVGFGSLVVFVDTVFFSFHIDCELVNVAFLKELTNKLKLCFVSVL